MPKQSHRERVAVAHTPGRAERVIIYRDQRRRVDPRALLHAVGHDLRALGAVTAPSPDAILRVLINAGELASAVADANAPEIDDAHIAAERLLSVVNDVADAAHAQWRGDPCTARAGIHAATRSLTDCESLDLPRTVRLGISEGFAYYALGPELYAERARDWACECRPRFVWCIGLRTIGLTLASVAAAALRARDVQAAVCSLRPRGHPFDRRVALSSTLAERLTSVQDAWWLLVDEGPGLSGSSLAGAADALCRLGVPADRVVLMPGHAPMTQTFSGSTRARWERHRVLAAGEDTPGLASRRVGAVWNVDSAQDLAAGEWRWHTGQLQPVPATHPQHERRKYRLQRSEGETFLKFAGYGRYGDRIVERAQVSADAGWSPMPIAAGSGWIEFPWVTAPRPGGATTEHVMQLADYLGFVATAWDTTEAADTAPLAEMALTNTRACCSDTAALVLEQLIPHDQSRAVHVDGRLRPHEWFVVDGRITKTDGIEHFDDHFFPGPCDIAWDVAAAAEEWHLPDDAVAALVDRFTRNSGDRDIVRRLPFFRAAFLAFRAAYTTFGAEQLASTAEGARFAGEAAHYRRRLQLILEQSAWARSGAC